MKMMDVPRAAWHLLLQFHIKNLVPVKVNVTFNNGLNLITTFFFTDLNLT